jgi:hypothetical protein
MNCRDLDEYFDRTSEGTEPRLPPEARGHVENCEVCRRVCELLAAHRTLVGPELDPRLEQKIASNLNTSLEAVTPVPARRRLAMVLVGIVSLMSVILAAIIGAGGFKVMTWEQLLGMTVILGGGVALLADSVSRQMIPGSDHRLPPRALIVTLPVVFLCGMPLLFPWRHTNAFVGLGLRCTLRGLTIATLGMLLFWPVVRRGAVLSRDLLGASVGLLAGLTGATVLQFSCRLLEAKHLAGWHAGMVVAAMLEGLLLARVLAKTARAE